MLRYILSRGISTASAVSPLKGVRILDLSRVLAGPYATMILGDLGAEIIKVESPLSGGDDTRRWGPPFVGAESCYFLSVNRNKKSVCLDFKKEKGLKIIKDLASKSDVLIENFLPGKLESLGLGYDQIRQVCPNLIYVSVTGFGSEGPYSDRGGYDVIAASMGGLIDVTGPENGPPCKAGLPVTDLATGLYAHGAILASLLRRSKVGKGEWIQVDLLSTQIATLVNLASNYINSGQSGKRYGTSHASVVPYQSFKTKDGYFTICVGNNEQFRDFCLKILREDLFQDEKFKTNADRVQYRNELIGEIEFVLQNKTNKEWSSIFKGSRFAYGPVNDIKSVFEDEHVKTTRMVQEVSHFSLGNVSQIRPAVSYSDCDNRIRSGPPTLGQHTEEVLKNILEYDDENIRDLRSSKVII